MDQELNNKLQLHNCILPFWILLQFELTCSVLVMDQELNNKLQLHNCILPFWIPIWNLLFSSYVVPSCQAGIDNVQLVPLHSDTLSRHGMIKEYLIIRDFWKNTLYFFCHKIDLPYCWLDVRCSVKHLHQCHLEMESPQAKWALCVFPYSLRWSGSITSNMLTVCINFRRFSCVLLSHLWEASNFHFYEWRSA
jgi:hypothetical protein